MATFRQNSIWRNKQKTFPVCVQAYLKITSSLTWSLTLLSHGLRSQNWSDYKTEGVGFKIYKNLKMLLYSQKENMSHPKTFIQDYSGHRCVPPGYYHKQCPSSDIPVNKAWASVEAARKTQTIRKYLTCLKHLNDNNQFWTSVPRIFIDASEEKGT